MATYTPPTPARVAIRELPTTEQPTMRLRRYGPATLSSAELLTIVLGLHDLGQAETLLAHYGGMGSLSQAPLNELMQQPGLGPQRAAKLKAAGELGRRLTSGYAERVEIRSSAAAAHIAMAEMADLNQPGAKNDRRGQQKAETCGCLALKTQAQPGRDGG